MTENDKKATIKVLKREISVLHFFMIITSKVFIFISLILLIFNFGPPFAYPLLIIGVIGLMSGLYFLFKKEIEVEKELEKELKEEVKVVSKAKVAPKTKAKTASKAKTKPASKSKKTQSPKKKK